MSAIMLKKLENLVMSDKGSRGITALLLTVVAGLLGGMFVMMVYFLQDFSTFRRDVNNSFYELKQAQSKHVLDEILKNAEQDTAIKSNTIKINANTKEIKDIKQKIGGVY